VSCFSSADESAHYGFSVCMLLEQYRDALRWEEEGVVELGTGDATAIAGVVAALPGLRAEAGTRDDCREELRSALALWLQVRLCNGTPIPSMDGVPLFAWVWTNEGI